MINIDEKKRKILSFLENSGPSLPVRIAKVIEMEPVFTSAILSELLNSKDIKLSSMKVGSSPLYLIEGQEKQLENFTDNLKSAEKAAYLKLKKEVVLIDEEEDPTTRVALRGLKDFAKPFKFKDKIYWRYAFNSEEEVEQKLNPKKLEKTPERKEPAKIEEKENISEKDLSEESTNKKEEINLNNSPITEKENPEKKNEELEEVPKAWESKKEEVKKLKEEKKVLEDIFEENEPEFLNEVKKYLSRQNLDLLKEIQIDKKEVVATINMVSQLGDINFLLIARDKKTVSLEELSSALQRARHEQMPCLYLVKKEPTKKIQEYLNSNFLIKVEVMN